MHEITLHRTGGPLNEAFKIERDRDKYDISVKAHGQWGRKFRIEFQGDRAFAEDTGGPAGLSEEVLLAVLVDYLGSSNRYHGVDREMERGANNAYDKLRETLFWLSTCENK